MAIFFPEWLADCRQLCQFWRENTPFVNIPFEQGEDIAIRHQWTPNIGSIHRMANFMFKYPNIYLKNGASLLWNLWLVCGKMINSSLESAVCKTPHIIKHSDDIVIFIRPWYKLVKRLIKGFSLRWCNQNFEFFVIYASYRGPCFHEYSWVKIKIHECKLGTENTSWIRKYHKYNKMDRNIRNCDIFSTECKKLHGNT